MSDWEKIRYPDPLRPGDTIGITAPSEGVQEKGHPRLDLCIKYLRDLGFKILEGECLRKNEKYISAPREERIKDLMRFWQMDEIKAIFPPWGGEILIHLLPLIDFKKLATSSPKWILGYSDTSTFLFALTIMTGIATAHGTTLMEMIPDQTGDLSQKWREVLSLKAGDSIQLQSSSHFETSSTNWFSVPSAAFNLTERTEWKCLQNGKPLDEVEVKGRIVGGCLETISCLTGTPYGNLTHFKEQFSQEGVILYLENADSPSESFCRLLWNLRLAGWFDGINGLLLGRTKAQESEQFQFIDALKDVFDDLSIPIIYDVDIGHCPPQMTLINGSCAVVNYFQGKGRVTLALS